MKITPEFLEEKASGLREDIRTLEEVLSRIKAHNQWLGESFLGESYVSHDVWASIERDRMQAEYYIQTLTKLAEFMDISAEMMRYSDDDMSIKLE